MTLVKKIPNMNFIKITILIAICITSSYASVLVVRTPELPSENNPSKAYDVYSINMARQIHKTLFDIDAFGTPQPSLVSSFKVEQGGEIYKFELGVHHFSNGDRLRAIDVKESLENRILEKTPRYLSFKFVKGFEEFVQKKRKSLVGIVAKGNMITINLERPDFKLLYALSDLRFAIVKKIDEKYLGLGDYVTLSSKHDRLVLELRRKHKGVTQVVYTTKCYTPENTKAHIIHLFGYRKKCNKEKLKKISYLSFKDYLIHLNPDKLEYNDRKIIYQLINKQELLKLCYPNQKESLNFVPAGYAGYSKLLKKPKVEIKKQENLGKRKVKVWIAKGILNAKCVKNYLEKVLGNLNAEIKIKETSSINKSWLRSELDVIVWYVESEQFLDHISYFTPSSSFQLGIRNMTPSLSKLLNKSKTIKEYFSSMRNYSQKVLDSLTVIPLFKPKDFIFLSEGIKIQNSLISSPTYLNFNKFKFDDDEK